MITITVACVGGLKESYFREAAAEYVKRLGIFCKLKIEQVDEYTLPDKPSKAQIDAAVDTEGKRLLAKIPPSAVMIALCIEGKMLDSRQLADKIALWGLGGVSHIAFLIGGSFGLSDEVKSRAGLKLSMSLMTFPHQLARVLLLEQIYRTFQISAGGKYHK